MVANPVFKHSSRFCGSSNTRHLLTENSRISSWKFRNQRVEYHFDAANGADTGTVVVLMEVRSTSAGEYFAGSQQAIDRAATVGERSPGYLLVANWKKLLKGASLMYAFAQPIMPDGKVIEGREGWYRIWKCDSIARPCCRVSTPNSKPPKIISKTTCNDTVRQQPEL